MHITGQNSQSQLISCAAMLFLMAHGEHAGVWTVWPEQYQRAASPWKRCKHMIPAKRKTLCRLFALKRIWFGLLDGGLKKTRSPFSLATEDKCLRSLISCGFTRSAAKGRIEMREDFSFQSCTISHETLEDGPQRMWSPLNWDTSADSSQSLRKNICLVALFYFIFFPSLTLGIWKELVYLIQPTRMKWLSICEGIKGWYKV